MSTPQQRRAEVLTRLSAGQLSTLDAAQLLGVTPRRCSDCGGALLRKGLGIQSIPALSLQAKGRIERRWRTLQDRLTKESRLAGVNTPEEANAFLPSFIESYNARFAQPAAEAQSAWQALPQGADLHYHFSTCETRQVRRDRTIAWLGRTLQIVPEKGEPSLSSKGVEVRVSPEGALAIYHDGRRVTHREVTPQAQGPTDKAHRVRTPPPGRGADAQAEARRRGWLYGKVQ